MPARRIAVANQKGGVGKTTTALNLARVLAGAGRNTLLVDLDPQGNATTGLGLAKVEGAGTAGLFEGRTEGVVTPTKVPGLAVVTAAPGLEQAESRLTRADERTRFFEALGTVAEAYDEVLLDCPPSMGGITRGTLAWADEVLVPIQCEFFAMEGLTQILAVIDQVRAGENPRLVLAGILLTMFEPDLPFHREVVENVRKHLGDKVCRTVIPRDVGLAEAASHGVPLLDYDCLSRGTFGYVELGKELLHHARKAPR